MRKSVWISEFIMELFSSRWNLTFEKKLNMVFGSCVYWSSGNLVQTPTIGVFGDGHQCHTCFKPFESRTHLLSHRKQSKHHLELADCIVGNAGKSTTTSTTTSALRTESVWHWWWTDKATETDIRRKIVRMKTLKCKIICSREFSQRTFLTKHKAKHQEQNDTKNDVRVSSKAKGSSLKCSVCSKLFSNELMLVKHRQTLMHMPNELDDENEQCLSKWSRDM